jgi:hypothetical protein
VGFWYGDGVFDYWIVSSYGTYGPFSGNSSNFSSSCGNPIGIPCGGTGATTAAGALANLGAVNKAGDTMTGPLVAPLFRGPLQGQSLIASPCALYAYSDSLGSGDYANTPIIVNGYVGLVANDLGLIDQVNGGGVTSYCGVTNVPAETNFSIGGAQSEDVNAIEMFGNGAGYAHENPGITAPIALLQVGTNEAKWGLSSLTVFHTTHLASLSWRSIPSNYKTFGQACTPTGTWTNDTTFLTGVGVDSHTNGSTLTCSLTTYGQPIYIWYTVANASAGTFTYSVDSATPVSVNAFTTPAINSGLGTTAAVGFIRVPAIAAGTHSVVFAVTSSTSSSNNVGITAIGTPSPINWWNNATFVGGVPYELNNANAAAVASYNAASYSDYQTLYNDTVPVFWVPIQSCVGSSSTYVTNSDGYGIHWTQAGHTAAAQCYESVMQPQRGWQNLVIKPVGENNGIKVQAQGNAPLGRFGWNNPNNPVGGAGAYGMLDLSSNWSFPNAVADNAALGTDAIEMNVDDGSLCLETGTAGVQPVCAIKIDAAGNVTQPHGNFNISPSNVLNVGNLVVGAPITNGTSLSPISANTTEAFQINPYGSGTPVLNVDTTNKRIGLGTAAPTTGLEVNLPGAVLSTGHVADVQIDANGTDLDAGLLFYAASAWLLEATKSGSPLGTDQFALYHAGVAALQFDGTTHAATFVGAVAAASVKVASGTAMTGNQGNGTLVQHSTGTTTTNDCVKFDANGNTVDAGAACGSGGGGSYNTTGSDNTANGLEALFSNTTGSYNTANGLQALYLNTTGSNNTANGFQALYDNTTGSQNTANGLGALFFNTTGNNNTANGFWAGQYIADGVTANQTSSNSVYEGFQAYPLASGDTNENVIGNTAIGHGSNTTTLGNTATVGTWLNGTQHITATAPITSAGTIAAYSTNAGGEITGLSAATSVTITFANSGWTNAAFCTANSSTTLATNVYNSIQSKTAVTFTFPALTGNLFYHCDGN